MKLDHLTGQDIQLVIGNCAVKGKLKEVKEDYILLDSRGNDVYIDPGKIVYCLVEKDEQEEKRVIQ
jgi:hypothetical protein